MKMKKFIAVLSIASMMAVTAVGCGSSSSADTSSDNGSDTASEWDAASAITVVSREEGSGTRGAFTELFGVVDEDDNDMIRYDDNCI